MFLAVPDEENSSAGMRGTIRKLNSFIKEKKKLDVIAALQGTLFPDHSQCIRPIIPSLLHRYDGQNHAFLLLCREGRTRQRLLSRPQLGSFGFRKLSRRWRQIRLSLKDKGNWLLSPACLGFEIRRNGYSVTLPERAVCYFNLLTIEKTPQEILSLCVGACTRCRKFNFRNF